MASKSSKKSGQTKSVLFICLGNICRSPIAEAVFLKLLAEQGKTNEWKVDSAAMGNWHVGKGPDSRAMQTLKKMGINNYVHKARQLCEDDYTSFDVIFGMDDDNMDALKKKRPGASTAKLSLLGEFDPEGETIIRDPYFDSRSDTSGFDKVYEQCVRCCKAFLEQS